MRSKGVCRITVLLEDEEFDRFDSYCEDRGFKKSTLVARLIRQHLDTEAYGEQRSLPSLRFSGKEPR